MNKYTGKEIDLMDLLFTAKFFNSKKDADGFMTEFNMSYDEYIFTENAMLKTGEDIGLIKVQWFDDGTGAIIKFNRHVCDKFFDMGGFKGHFLRLRISIHKKEAKSANADYKMAIINGVITFLITVLGVLLAFWIGHRLK